MRGLTVRLFGKFSVLRDGRPVEGLDARRVQELFSYLLLHRDRPHPRAAIAGLLWSDRPGSQPLKHLRQALWQLHSALEESADLSQASRVVLVDTDASGNGQHRAINSCLVPLPVIAGRKIVSAKVSRLPPNFIRSSRQ